MDFISKILFASGMLLMPFPVFMIALTIISCFTVQDDTMPFVLSSCIFIGLIVLALLCPKQGMQKFHAKEIYFILLLTWLIAALLSCFPIFFTLNVSFIDAFFESTSGITTTGATVINDIDNVTPLILIWRSILQWIGGIWSIYFAVITLMFINTSTNIVSTTHSRHDSRSPIPDVISFVQWSSALYLLLTCILCASYYFAGMSLFDAINHSMTTVSTGGFSTHNESMGFFQSHAIQYIAVVFMVIGSMPFIALIAAVRHNSPLDIIRNSQVYVFLILLLAFGVLTYLVNTSSDLTSAVFTTISLMTGTGYVLSDIEDTMGYTSIIVLLICMIIGGCSSSTACGIKIFRVQIIASSFITYFRAFINPWTPKVISRGFRYDYKQVLGVMSHLFIYFLLFFISVLIMTYCNVDLLSSVTSSITCLSNVGPAFGNYIGGSMGNFYYMPNIIKLWLILMMIIGRLEFFVFIASLALLKDVIFNYPNRSRPS